MNKILATVAALATVGFFAVNAANAADGRDQSLNTSATVVVEGRNAAVVTTANDAYIAQAVRQDARSTH